MVEGCVARKTDTVSRRDLLDLLETPVTGDFSVSADPCLAATTASLVTMVDDAWLPLTDGIPLESPVVSASPLLLCRTVPYYVPRSRSVSNGIALLVMCRTV